MNNYFEYIHQTVFKDEFDAYLKSLDKPLTKGIVLNHFKVNAIQLLDSINLNLFDSLFAKDSFLVNDDAFYPSNYALYHAGLFYSQELSASSAVEVLNPLKGEFILDACASPGGKTFQIANRVGRNGLVISNEKDNARANVLAHNCIDFGLENTCVINEDATNLSKKLDCVFDRILVDAPCSGEGMIKKEKESVLNQWSVKYLETIANLQLDILDDVAKLLKKDGTLVYSTCTFNTIENEGVVVRFLKNHPEFILDNIDVPWGRNGIVIHDCEELKKCRRIFPMDGGEGHFIARFIKAAGPQNADYKKTSTNPLSKKEADYIYQAIQFIPKHMIVYKNNVIIANGDMVKLDRCKVIKYYTNIGEFATKRFEPSFDLARIERFKNQLATYAINLNQLNDWLKGYPIDAPIKGWVIVTYQGLGISFGKGDGKVIKNKYPKAKRIHYDVI